MANNESEQFTLHSKLKEDCIELIDFPLSKLLLCNDANYPWFILVPKVVGILEIYQLEWAQQQQLLNESSMLAEVLVQVFQAEKLNVAALGNVVPQLHVHHVVRYQSDVAWPKPIWGEVASIPYTEQQIAEIKSKVLPQLEAVLAQ